MNEFINKEGYPDPVPYRAIRNLDRKRMYRPLVYICSPYAGDIEANVENARRYCRYAVDKGCIPLASHLLYPQFMSDDDPDERALGLRFGHVLLSKCKELWVFGDVISSGMHQEIDYAKSRGIPIKLFTNKCD